MPVIANNLVDFPEEDSCRLRKALGPPPIWRSLEEAKLNTIVRLARSILESDQSYRVVICLQFVDHLKRAGELLAEFDPVVATTMTLGHMDGRLTIVSRKCFQERRIQWDNRPRYVFFSHPLKFDEQLKADFRHESTFIQFIYDKQNEREIVYHRRRGFKDYPRLIEGS